MDAASPCGCGHCSAAGPDLSGYEGDWDDAGPAVWPLLLGAFLTASLFGVLVVAVLRCAFG